MLSYLECMFLKMYVPDVGFARMLEAYNSAVEFGDNHVDFISMTEEEISTIVEVIVTAISTKSYNVNGRKSGYPLVARLFSAINSLHHLAEVDSPCQLNAMKIKLAKLKEEWVEHGAPSVVVLVFII